MNVSDFDFTLPRNLIAQRPARPRDRSRLFVYDRVSKRQQHVHFSDITHFLKSGDVLVINDTKVFPARLFGTKETGGKVEVLLTRELRPGIWESLVGARGVMPGKRLFFSRGSHGPHGLTAEVLKKQGSIFTLHFNQKGKRLHDTIQLIGHTPLPPYIASQGKRWARQYQTVYANAEKAKSVAAPTAGLHFTPPLLARLVKQGIQIEHITLHVGYGTFQPVKVARVEEHVMHPEWIEITSTAARRITTARKAGRRIIAVGTTTTRALEAVTKNNVTRAHRGEINMFIYPGYRFRATGGMITNFHLPQSTLIMLVAAFVGDTGEKKNTREAIQKTRSLYKAAVRRRYRFYSFGDAMLLV